MGERQPTILGLSEHSTTESELLWRAKGLELAASEKRLIQWMKAKPDNEQLRDVYLDYSYLLQMYTELNTAIGLLKDRNQSLRKLLNYANEEIGRLEKQRDEARDAAL